MPTVNLVSPRYNSMRKSLEEEIARLREGRSAEQEDLFKAANEARANESAGALQLEQQIATRPTPPLHDVLPNLPVMVQFLSSLASNMSSAISGNQDYRNRTQDFFEGYRQTQQQQEAANVQTKQVDAAQRQRDLFQIQYGRYGKLADQAEKLGDLELAAKYGEKQKQLSEALKRQAEMEQNAATEESAGMRTEAGIQGDIDVANIRAQADRDVAYSRMLGAGASGMDDKEYQSWKRMLLEGASDKKGNIKNIPLLQATLAFGRSANHTLYFDSDGNIQGSWIKELASMRVKTTMGDKPLFDLRDKKTQALIQAAAESLFPEEMKEEAAKTKEEDLPAADYTPEEKKEIEKLRFEYEKLVNTTTTGGLKKLAQTQRERRMRRIRAILQAKFGLDLSAPGIVPTVEGITVSGNEE